jgi:uncharacterized delta-60 repeat protein
MKSVRLSRALILLSLLFLLPSAALQAQVGGAVQVSGTVYAVAVQADGKILLGGLFNEVNGSPRNNLARLNADGTLDDSFLGDSGAGIFGTVYALAVDSTGHIVVGGQFNRADSESASNLVRYRPDGTLDSGFPQSGGPNGTVYAVSVLIDGRVVAGGEFNQAGGTSAQNLALYAADGSASTSDAPSLEGTVRALAANPGSGFAAGGQFQLPGSAGRNALLQD